MEFLTSLLDFVLHINDHLDQLVIDYGTTIYAILFLIIFVETGLVVMPFLPGDSLLFAAGAICARPGSDLSIYILIGLLFLAAVLGDNVNYTIGRFAGQKATRLKIGNRSLVKQEYIDQTHKFFEKYGTKAIIMARFVPIVRTFTPFVAGVGKMDYRKKFLPYDIAGGFLWITSMSLSGYFLGNLPFFQDHFEMVVLGIILLSVMPMVIAYLRHRFQPKKEKV
ncbi:MAG: DedA family protein [Bacteroidia bacterium]